MAKIDSMLEALSEITIARDVGRRHDDARFRYTSERIAVEDFDEFVHRVGHYYNYHFAACMSAGSPLRASDAEGRAVELLEREYHHSRNGDIVSCYNDAHDGTNNGMRAILDLIADGLKREDVLRYTRRVFDRYVAPNCWADKVEIIRQFIAKCGVTLSPHISVNEPERYAANYRDLIQAYVSGLQRISQQFRRL